MVRDQLVIVDAKRGYAIYRVKDGERALWRRGIPTRDEARRRAGAVADMLGGIPVSDETSPPTTLFEG